ncbi:MAG: malto-oligosyltrehalose trehalohydrolase [Planctomycetota bacterium]
MAPRMPLPVGAEVTPEGVRFRVWAPRRRQVEVMLDGRAPVTLVQEDGGYFSGDAHGARAGARYRFRLDGADAFPDPASRSQPDGPHGPSQVIDPDRFHWHDERWPGLGAAGHILYELHVGTFTAAGTWSAAAAELAALARLGITVIEMMPVHQFPGRFGWGYDGVGLFAPSHQYGSPDDLRRFIDAAHQLGLGVILDVVYNHCGPDGNYWAQYADSYFTDKYRTDWGAAINYDGPHSAPVRELIIANAGYWIQEFHFDGLRLDATQDIHDASPRHVLGELVAHARACGAPRQLWIVAENEPQDRRLLQPIAAGGHGVDAMWSDDFHHTAMVALTGQREAYYSDYRGTPQEIVSALKWGCLYQGQYYSWQNAARGTPFLDVAREATIAFLENHDQVANTLRGERLHQIAGNSLYRTMMTALMLGPGTPMLFQGQEFGSAAPFLFFADHHRQLAARVRAGRGEFLKQFRSLSSPSSQELLHDPADPQVFARCKLDRQAPGHEPALAFMTDLIALRRADPAFRSATRSGLDGAVLSEHALALRYFMPYRLDRLLVVNLGRELRLRTMPEPLLAPPLDARWHLRFASEDVRYHGRGIVAIETSAGWCVPGQSAALLVAMPDRVPR